MKWLLLYVIFLMAGMLSLPAQALRGLEIEGIPLRLQGVSDDMVEPAKLVLETQLEMAGDTEMSPPLADDLAFFLQQRYRELGYSSAVVDWDVTGGAAVLNVTEGPRRTVGEISFQGVDPALAEELKPYVTRQTREREGRLAKWLPFVEADIEDGIQFVVRRLQSEGYLEASAAPPVFTVDEATGAVNIHIVLDPGPLSVFGNISVLGDPGPLSPESMEKIKSLTGQPFSEVTLENVRKEVLGDLQQRGWYAAEVTAEAPRAQGAGGRIPAAFTINPGLPFTITGVRAEPGLSRGAQRVATSVFRPAAGDIYDPAALDLLHRRAMDTGIFSRLDVEPVVLGPDTMELVVKGEEAKPKVLGFFGGYETFYGPIAGVEARHLNIWNTGNALGVRAEVRGTGLNGSLQWTDPAIFGTGNSLNLALALETFSFKDYERNTLSFRPTLMRRFNRNITAEIFASATANEAESDLLTPEELGPEEYQTLTAGGRLTFDYRNNPLNPRSGWLAGLAVEGGFDQGGDREEDINFVRTDINASWYYPFGESLRMAVGARGSTMNVSGSVEEVPIDLRLFNGGATTVRSFAEREMGEFSDRGDTPLGGLATAVINLEFSYEVITNLEVAAFADAGSISREEASLFEMEDVRYAIGMGVRYQLPIGPLRVDYGFNPNRKQGEDAGALHVTFGFAF